MTTQTTASAAPASLYEQLGGRAVIAAVIDRMYEYVMEDPELRPFFTRTDLQLLKASQVEFFSALTGGPVVYRGTPIRHAHAGLGIKAAHFDRVTGHLIEALHSQRVDPVLIDAIVGMVVPLKKAVVSSETSISAPPSAPTPVPVLSAPAEEPLADAAFLRATLECAPACLLVADAAGQVLFANDGAQRAGERLEAAFWQACGAPVGRWLGLELRALFGEQADRLFRTPGGLPFEGEVTVGEVALRVGLNGIFGPGNTLLGYVLRWEPAARGVEAKAAAEQVGGQTRVNLSMGGSTMSLAVDDGDVRIQYTPPARDGAPPRAIALRIGTPE